MSIVELQSKDLKSNMDRFIGDKIFLHNLFLSDLKSNMDRFIAADYGKNWLNASDLKSNMDRFIVRVALKKNCKI